MKFANPCRVEGATSQSGTEKKSTAKNTQKKGDFT